MRVNEIAAAIHLKMVNDNRFGYSWEERHGFRSETWSIGGNKYSVNVGDYDCASSSIDSWRLALSKTKYRGALDAATYTGNMKAVFLASGLFEWKPMSFLAEPGDLYLNESNHVAMCQTQVPDVLSEFCWGDNGAYGNKRGDQSGQEAYAHAYYDYPWDGILHYNGKADGTSSDATKKTSSDVKPKVTLDGIDIASWQVGIDVSKVSADFVIVKVSGGTSYVNDRAHGSWRDWREIANQVLKSGKLLGLYHYAGENGQRSSGKAEAEFFLKQVKGFEGKALMCLDWEAKAQSFPVSYAKEWLDTVAKATGSTPVFYGYAYYLNNRDHSAIAKYPLWMASYLNRYEWGSGYVKDPANTWDTGSWKKMQMYQYASTRTVKGYSGRLDVNVFYGSEADWKALCGKAPEAAKEPPQPRYRVFREGAWRAWKKAGKTSGVADADAYDFDFRDLGPKGWFQLTLSDGTVLPRNRRNSAHKVPVMGVTVYYDTDTSKYHDLYEAVYRVYAGGRWLKEERDDSDGGAGDDRHPVRRLQLRIERC
jgi:GH25 family lysozyme M1 (1,4-beta-N-acetylmuramidase)